jgi:hypothetical protein
MKGFVEQGVCSELVNISAADVTQFEDCWWVFWGLQVCTPFIVDHISGAWSSQWA